MPEEPTITVPFEAKRTGRVSYTHEAMIDLILQEPSVRTHELAALFGYSAGWVSRILASDSFQSRLAAKRMKLVDPHIAHSINERLRSVAIHSLSIVSEKLESEQSASYALEALGISSRALGLSK